MYVYIFLGSKKYLQLAQSCSPPAQPSLSQGSGPKNLQPSRLPAGPGSTHNSSRNNTVNKASRVTSLLRRDRCQAALPAASQQLPRPLPESWGRCSSSWAARGCPSLWEAPAPAHSSCSLKAYPGRAPGPSRNRNRRLVEPTVGPLNGSCPLPSPPPVSPSPSGQDNCDSSTSRGKSCPRADASGGLGSHLLTRRPFQLQGTFWVCRRQCPTFSAHQTLHHFCLGSFSSAQAQPETGCQHPRRPHSISGRQAC